MNVLLSVVVDLLQFALHPIAGLFRRTAVMEPAAIMALPPQSIPTLLTGTDQISVAAPLQQSTAKADPISRPALQVPSSIMLTTQPVRVQEKPVVMFDGAVGRLNAGVFVTAGERVGRWQHIEATTGVVGWVPIDVLEPAHKHRPMFIDGVIYGANNADVVTLRRIIQDEFSGAELQLPLQAEEFVTYELHLRGRSLPWPEAVHRVAGTWHRKLKGVPAVSMTVFPRTEAVMEYVSGEQGHVAYVTDVAPDQSIEVVGVGLISEGVYSSLLLSEEDWKSLAPVFISLM